MSPIGRRRRRPVLPYLMVGLVVAAGGLVLAGGVAKVPAASGSFDQEVNRSYAAQASVIVDESNVTGERLSTLMSTMAGLSRQALQDQLETLVLATSRTAASAAALAPPVPTRGMEGILVRAMDERASAIAGLRRAVDGLLGLSIPPQPGAPDSRGNAVAPPMSQTQAIAAIGTAGSELRAADRAYASVRSAFREAPGHATLPSSVWITDSRSWAQGSVQVLVSDVGTSPTLAPVTRVVLLQSTLRTGLGAVPPVPVATGSTGATSGSGTILPTKALGVTAVVANQGNVAVVGVTVSASVTPVGGGKGHTVSDRVSVAPGMSLTVALADLPVTPGQAYSLSVAVSPPRAQTDLSGTTDTYSIRIAPEAPPPTTPASTTTTTTKAKPKGTPKSKGTPKATSKPKTKA
ncbi:MAG: hypothetical protein ACYDHU_10835 [Acidimicrobiales bacterium]